MPTSDGNRWTAQPMLGFAVAFAALAIPLITSIVSSVIAARLLPREHGVLGDVAWWTTVLGTSTLVFVGAERVSRRLLPLASLAKMTLVFPDRAPKRLSVAWRAGTTKTLERTSLLDDTSAVTVPSEAAGDILALAASLSRHDRATRGHSERVRAFTDMIADELRLPQADRDRLRWASLLHDVGKLAVHADILNKPGRPSDEEWAALRNHPLEGRRLVAPLVPWLGEWSLAIEQHHESYDGSGYPFGLAGEDLSLAGRIVTVADSFEVMTAVRSYKKAMSLAAAREELTRCAGTQFDPAIVRAFLNISLGRLRWTIGPVSWIADVPLVAKLGVAGRGLITGAEVVAGATALSTVGILAAHASLHTTTQPHVTTRIAVSRPSSSRRLDLLVLQRGRVSRVRDAAAVAPNFVGGGTQGSTTSTTTPASAQLAVPADAKSTTTTTVPTSAKSAITTTTVPTGAKSTTTTTAAPTGAKSTTTTVPTGAKATTTTTVPKASTTTTTTVLAAPTTTSNPGTGTVTYDGVGTLQTWPTSGGNNLAKSVTYPSGAASGDLLLLVTANSHEETAPCPSGWTLQDDRTATTGDHASLEICYKFDVGETGVSVTSPSNAGTGFTAEVVAYANVNATAPFDVADVLSTSAAGASAFTPTGLITASASDTAVSIVMQNDATSTLPTLNFSGGGGNAQGFTADSSNGISTATSNATAVASNSIPGAQSTVTFPTWTTSDATAGSSVWVGISLSLRAT